MSLSLRNSKGAALTVVIIVIIMLTLLSAFAMNMGYNRQRLMKLNGASKAVAFYRARAGVVDAYWRLQNNIGPPNGANGAPPNQPGFFTGWPGAVGPYTLDVDGDGSLETTVNIGAVGANGLRNISANG